MTDMKGTGTMTVDTPGSKRIRVLGQKQSKYGCRTCKQRKIKCDESLPTCQRCSRSGRACGGYERVSRSRVVNHHALVKLVGSPPWTPPWYRPEQQHMVDLTLALFSLDPHRVYNKTSLEFASILLPQLVATRPYVNAAAGVLGAAYDKCILRQAHHEDQPLITRLSLNALRQMQDELQRPEPEMVPLMLTAMLLAGAESIQHKHQDALCHILGAFTINNLQSDSSPGSCGSTPPAPLTHHDVFSSASSFHDVLSRVDYHISMFAWGRPPQFPPLPVTTQMLYPSTVDDLTTGHAALQQWGLHFIGKAMTPDWVERIDFPSDLIEQQDYMVAWLNRWLQTYNSVFGKRGSNSPRVETAHLKILKAQVLTMLIAAANIKPPTQVSYDSYAPEFEEIIQCVEDVLNSNDSNTNSPAGSPHNHKSPLLPYSPIPGIIHPLNFTARKYRDSVSRRRAIDLLRRAGIEGPFHGVFEARVATRVVEIEEDRKPFKPLLAPHEVLKPSDIPDRNRIYISCLADDESELPHEGRQDCLDVNARSNNIARPWPVIKFIRRKGLAPTWRKVKDERTTQHVGNIAAQAEDDMWDIWEEVAHEAWPGT
ncbi:hypothetical protein PV10_07479 [Exophiala mesophila]|uniref:Zn(2)-C6 fungal-type domain-containing protein n=1 Tax=Exophiala mesophila TaxID=212818 RepID=A0A0D1Z807_EXOME|nr:uncharacterized protein PV10_07479 [Exophiala mesophila]KIV90139.1 hypothetical protein PV10_07479 [Exophiala mesophila]